MKISPVGWFDPTNKHFSTSKEDQGFTKLGQLWPLYTLFDYYDNLGDAVKHDLITSIELELATNRDEGGYPMQRDTEMLNALILTLKYYTPPDEMHVVEKYQEMAKSL